MHRWTTEEEDPIKSMEEHANFASVVGRTVGADPLLAGPCDRWLLDTTPGSRGSPEEF